MSAELALRIGLGIVTVTFGIDQLRKWEPWSAYVPEWLKWTMLPTEKLFWRTHASLNVLLGIALFAGLYLKWVALLVTLWLAVITFVTLFTDWRIAVRDLGLTAAALAMWLIVSGL